MKVFNYFNVLLTLLLFCLFITFSCRKEHDEKQPLEQAVSATAVKEHGHLKQTKEYQSDVAQKWQGLQLRILYQPQGVNPYGLNGVRNFAYCGIALYEAVVQGMPAYQSLHGQLTDMPEMPSTEPGKAYHWPTVANAALAYMNRHFYTATNTPAFQPSIDSLENVLNIQYESEINNAETFQRSKDFGRAVAEKVFQWSTNDGSLTVYPAYVTAAFPFWNNSAPNPAAIVGPYWGNNRSFVVGSTAGTASPLPPTYSEVAGSPYYEMVKEVYDISQALTDEQKATALYFNDEPGYKAGTHYISIFSQVMHNEDPSLDRYALAHAKTAVSMAESMIN